MNNGKYDTESYKLGQQAKVDRLYGPIKSHTKVCECCGKEYVWEGRLNTKAFTASKFCSRSCSNNRSEWWKSNASHYRTIALQNNEHKCVVCGFDKIVAIHHIDENKKNNDPSNLIPLCPNHHEMVHSKWKFEVQPFIEQWQKEFRGIGVIGNVLDLHSRVRSSNLLFSTRHNT
jgi:hypothetical protein